MFVIGSFKNSGIVPKFDDPINFDLEKKSVISILISLVNIEFSEAPIFWILTKNKKGRKSMK